MTNILSRIDDAKSAEVLFAGGQVRSPRFCWARKISEILPRAIYSDACGKSPSSNAGEAVTNSILNILRRRSFAQIPNCIVGWVAIDVVDETRRPFAIRVKPRKAVGIEINSKESDADIAVGLQTSGALSNHRVAFKCALPNKHTGFRIVIKPFSEHLGREGLNTEMHPTRRKPLARQIVGFMDQQVDPMPFAEAGYMLCTSTKRLRRFSDRAPLKLSESFNGLLASG